MIRLDYTFMTAPAVSGGLTAEELQRGGLDIERARVAMIARAGKGELGFLDLPRDERLVAQCSAVTSAARRHGMRDVVVLGIGGSALGPIALRTGLRPPTWNALDDRARDGFPRLHVLDNVDPITIRALLERLDLRTTLFLVTSKSGSTAETMAQYLVARGRLDAAELPLRDHLVFVTDPERGALRRIAGDERIGAVDIPPNVGGRYSVLSPVGVLPAMLIGIDVPALLEGAADMRARFESGPAPHSPAGAFALLQWLADTARDRRIHVLMPYSDPLRDLAAWFVQLWAESLGKTRGDGTHAGPTPIGARGTSDQHSQVQLFMEGPLDKTVTFLAVAEPQTDITIPDAASGVPDLAYLPGHRLGELLAAEREATAAALATRGRFNMTITVDRVDAWHVGALFMLFEIATVLAGELYAVNPLDQPGVELGKEFTYALLGRPGFDRTRNEWDALPKSDPRYVV